MAAITVSLAFMLLMGEIAVRVLDGYAVWPPTLAAHTPATPAPAAAAAAASRTDAELASRHARAVPLAPRVDQAWYQEDPTPIAPYPTPSWVTSRLEQPGNETRLFEFNRAFLEDRLCRDVATSMFGTQQDFLYFDPVAPDIYPSYRHLRRLSAPGWFTTNSLGYRGPDLAVDKPVETIRVAFVGASTTIGAFDFPFSFPELIGHWLNRWAAGGGRPFRFEVINSARTGIDSHSIAAIVRDELLPLEPDLVVFYAANQFWPQESIGYRLGRLYRRPGDAASPGRSALALRLRHLLDAWRGGDGSEPAKPIQWIRMAGVDEQNPDSRDKNLPAQLPEILADLDSMQASLAGIGSELVLTSFMWMARDGMTLDLPRQLRLFNHLNNDYWPASYDTMRRLVDIQNRAYRDFARRRSLPFFDIASHFPLEPELFADAVHLGYPGTRLKAWMLLQDLTRLIDERTSAGKLPRPMAHSGRQHPAFEQPSPRTVSRAAVLASCQR